LALETEIIRDVYVNLGMPPQRVLPLIGVTVLIHAALKYYNAGVELSTQNALIKVSAPFLATGIEMPLPNSWLFGDAALVEIASNVTETDWDLVHIVNLDVLEAAKDAGELAVSFFGSPTRMRFSWDPTQDTRRLRVSYDETVADPAAVDQLLRGMPDYYVPMVAARVSLDCVPDLMDKMPAREKSLEIRGSRLSVKLAEWERKWDWKVQDKHQQGQTKRGAFNRNRSGWARSG
jgi:hypothetical protein